MKCVHCGCAYRDNSQMRLIAFGLYEHTTDRFCVIALGEKLDAMLAALAKGGDDADGH